MMKAKILRCFSNIISLLVFYSAVDNYLDEKMGPDTKPNDKPYKDGDVIILGCRGSNLLRKDNQW